ncbi:MAG TPA: ATP-binding protein [Iamia sp.]|nr:ATP-binding protein [Iamia sp.]
MEASPFPYQGPLEPEQVQGRDELVADLVERVSEHRVTALLGPRRYGKTSVLRRVARDVIHGGASVVWVDLYEAASMADVAVRFDAALARVPGAFATTAAKVAAGLSLNLGLIGVELRAPERDRPDPALVLQALLDTLIRAARDTPTVVVMDEFSSVAKVPGAAGALRTGLQHHFQQIGLVFAGSEPSTMRMLFTDQAQPFYAQADIVPIGPLARVEVVATVVDGFAATGRSAGPVAGHIAHLARGHPQRTMQLADACWRLVPPGGAADEGTWADGLAAVRDATSEGNERLFSGFHDGEKLVLRVLASGGSLFGSAGRLLGLATGTAQHARQALVDKGQVVAVDGRYEVVDPILADWVARRLPV